MVKVKKFKFELGLLFCLLGNQFSRIAMEAFSIRINITNLFFFIAILLVVNIHEILRFKLLSFNKTMAIILFYQIMVLIYAYSTRISIYDGLSATIFTWFCIAFILAVSSNPYQKIDTEIFLKVGWWTTGFCNVILCWIASSGFQKLSRVSILRNGSDRLTLSVIAFAFLVYNLCYERKRIMNVIFTVIFMLTAILNIVIFSRKGLFVSCFFVYIYHFARKMQFHIDKRRLLKNIFFIIMALISIYMVGNFFSQTSVDINTYLVNVKEAILGFLNRGENLNNSGYIRNLTRKEMWKEYTNTFSYAEILLGKGYCYRDLDFPYFQAFTDFGIVGGIYYLIIQLVIPLKMILKKTEDKALMFAQYYAINTIAQNLYSGMQFGQYKFVPIVILAYLFYREKVNIYKIKSDCC